MISVAIPTAPPARRRSTAARSGIQREATIGTPWRRSPSMNTPSSASSSVVMTRQHRRWSGSRRGQHHRQPRQTHGGRGSQIARRHRINGLRTNVPSTLAGRAGRQVHPMREDQRHTQVRHGERPAEEVGDAVVSKSKRRPRQIGPANSRALPIATNGAGRGEARRRQPAAKRTRKEEERIRRGDASMVSVRSRASG